MSTLVWLSLRLPLPLLEALRELAAASDRSVSAQVRVILADAVKTPREAAPGSTRRGRAV